MQGIQIKILSSDEFDDLPEWETRGADISDSLGFADTINKRVYVRDTGIRELNRYLVNHEVEHLFSDEQGHDDPFVEGIRHKKFFKDILRPFYNPINLPIPGLQHDKGPLGTPKPEPPPAQPDFTDVLSGLFARPATPSNQPSSVVSQEGGGDGVGGGSVVGRLGTPLGGGQNLGQPQQFGAGIDPELAQRLKGFLSGRIPFLG